MSYLSRREIDELKSSIDKIIYKTLGCSDSSVLRIATDCLSKGYDKRKISDKLSSYLDSKKASKISEKLDDLVDNFKNNVSKKRPHEGEKERESKRPKKNETKDEKSMKNEQIDAKMTNKNVNISSINIPPPSIYGIPMGLLNRGDADKARKIAQLQAQIKSKLSTGILGNVIQIPIETNKPTPLILDEEGRTVDKTGKAVHLTHVTPTLKANMRAMKRDQLKGISGDKHHDESHETTFIDPRIGVKPPIRNKKSLRFHEPGKFQQLAERLRMKVGLILMYHQLVTYYPCSNYIIEK